jgi:hypothetical protein
VGGSSSQRLAWTAGGLLALAQVCERAVERQIWWSKVIALLNKILTRTMHWLRYGGFFCLGSSAASNLFAPSKRMLHSLRCAPFDAYLAFCGSR